MYTEEWKNTLHGWVQHHARVGSVRSVYLYACMLTRGLQVYTEEGKKTPEEEEAVRKLLHQEAAEAEQQQQKGEQQRKQ